MPTVGEEDTGSHRVAELRRQAGVRGVHEGAKAIYVSFAFIASLVTVGFVAAVWIGANLASAKAVEGHEIRITSVERSIAVIGARMDDVLYYQREMAKRAGVAPPPVAPLP